MRQSNLADTNSVHFLCPSQPTAATSNRFHSSNSALFFSTNSPGSVTVNSSSSSSSVSSSQHKRRPQSHVEDSNDSGLSSEHSNGTFGIEHGQKHRQEQSVESRFLAPGIGICQTNSEYVSTTPTNLFLSVTSSGDFLRFDSSSPVQSVTPIADSRVSSSQGKVISPLLRKQESTEGPYDYLYGHEKNLQSQAVNPQPHPGRSFADERSHLYKEMVSTRSIDPSRDLTVKCSSNLDVDAHADTMQSRGGKTNPNVSSYATLVNSEFRGNVVSKDNRLFFGEGESPNTHVTVRNYTTNRNNRQYPGYASDSEADDRLYIQYSNRLLPQRQNFPRKNTINLPESDRRGWTITGQGKEQFQSGPVSSYGGAGVERYSSAVAVGHQSAQDLSAVPQMKREQNFEKSQGITGNLGVGTMPLFRLPSSQQQAHQFTTGISLRVSSTSYGEDASSSSSSAVFSPKSFPYSPVTPSSHQIPHSTTAFPSQQRDNFYDSPVVFSNNSLYPSNQPICIPSVNTPQESQHLSQQNRTNVILSKSVDPNPYQRLGRSNLDRIFRGNQSTYGSPQNSSDGLIGAAGTNITGGGGTSTAPLVPTSSFSLSALKLDEFRSINTEYAENRLHPAGSRDSGGNWSASNSLASLKQLSCNNRTQQNFTPPPHAMALGVTAVGGPNLVDENVPLPSAGLTPESEGVDGILILRIIGGTHLGSNSLALRDLYCVVEIDSVRKARSMIRTSSEQFEWDETFELDMESGLYLCLLIYQWDQKNRHRLCFYGNLHLGRLKADMFRTQTRRDKVALNLEPKGTLLLEAEFIDIHQAFARYPTSHPNAIFGAPLNSVIQNQPINCRVPLVVKRCVDEVDKRGLEVVGIYRLHGSLRLKCHIRDMFEKSAGDAHLGPEAVPDIHAVTAVLKDYLRELPEPLFSNALYRVIMDAVMVNSFPSDESAQNKNRRNPGAKLMLNILECLPPRNQDTVLFLLDHLKRVVKKSDLNRMGMANIASCFGPILLYPSPEVLKTLDISYFSLRRQVEILHFILDIWPDVPTPEPESKSQATKSDNQTRQQQAQSHFRRQQSLNASATTEETRRRPVVSAANHPPYMANVNVPIQYQSSTAGMQDPLSLINNSPIQQNSLNYQQPRHSQRSNFSQAISAGASSTPVSHSRRSASLETHSRSMTSRVPDPPYQTPLTRNNPLASTGFYSTSSPATVVAARGPSSMVNVPVLAETGFVTSPYSLANTPNTNTRFYRSSQQQQQQQQIPVFGATPGNNPRILPQQPSSTYAIPSSNLGAPGSQNSNMVSQSQEEAKVRAALSSTSTGYYSSGVIRPS